MNEIIELIFATNNEHKVQEIKSVLGNNIKIKSLKEAGIEIDIPEPHHTLQANASEKSNTIHQLTNKNCFSEDTGLEVEILNSEPGVKSARYAENEKQFKNNTEKLLFNLKDKTNRTAQFRTVISLILNNKEYFFVGVCKGNIIDEQRGNSGFGYDPVFMPNGSNKTFAEMPMEEKNLYSHRKKAMQQLIEFLSQFGKKLS